MTGALPQSASSDRVPRSCVTEHRSGCNMTRGFFIIYPRCSDLLSSRGSSELGARAQLASRPSAVAMNELIYEQWLFPRLKLAQSYLGWPAAHARTLAWAHQALRRPWTLCFRR